MMTRILGFLGACALVLGAWTGDVTAGEHVDPQDSRLHFVHKLIETSSVAKRVASSSDPEVEALRRKAREHYQNAVRLHDEGDYAGTDTELMEATEAMFAAVRLMEEKQGAQSKLEKDLERKEASIRALLDAHARITKEKGSNPSNQKLRKAAETKLRAAQQLRDKGDMEEARRYFNEAYFSVKLAVSELREGDTLVRNLKFATKEEEYRYELDRNDTHKMLVRLLLKERVKSESTRHMVESFVEKAAQLRQKAEAIAKKGDYEQAIEVLEESTRQLVRAIRGAGIFIPG